MILKYNRLMEGVVVTEEMRERILRRTARRGEGKPAARRPWATWGAVAACLVIFAAGGLILKEIVSAPGNTVEQGNPIVAYASLDELSEALGYQVKELPFAPEQITYMAYWGQMAEIRGISAENAFRFRMSAGDEDVSGNYSSFPDIRQVEDGTRSVVLKGADGRYTLALWNEDGFSYSLEIDSALPAGELLAMLPSAE